MRRGLRAGGADAPCLPADPAGAEALKKLNDMRETFFRNVTHEFRTPLTIILGLSHDLQKDSITTDEAHDMGMTIERQGNRILRLINQLLDISKIRSAIGKPEWRNGNIVAYISMIVEMFEDYSRKRDIKLQFIPHENEIYTDFVPEYMNKLMSNLLSNAIKFTPALGKVSISLWRNGRRLHIVISDTGCGISKENLPHIFEEFYQADNNEEAGTGIGLALVYQIVKQLDGTISVESTEGKAPCLPASQRAPHSISCYRSKLKAKRHTASTKKSRKQFLLAMIPRLTIYPIPHISRSQ